MKFKLPLISFYLIIALIISDSTFSPNAAISASLVTQQDVAVILDLTFSNQKLLLPNITTISYSSFIFQRVSPG